MLIRIAQLGGGVLKVNLNTGNVGDALNTAGISTGDLEIRVCGQAVDRTYSLKDGDIITLVPKGGIKGEATFKIAGDIWQVHQNDPDENFPSDFHAHNKAHPETLDIYTGNVYSARTRQLVRRIPDKQLEAILRRVPKRLIR